MAKKVIGIKQIKKGKFYHFHEGSEKGHPGMVYWKNDNKNLYLAVTTDTSKGEHRTPIHRTSKDINQSYVYNRPLLAKRKNVGGERKEIKFDNKDKPLIKSISRRPFRETPDINRKDRRYMKKLKKKPRY